VVARPSTRAVVACPSDSRLGRSTSVLLVAWVMAPPALSVVGRLSSLPRSDTHVPRLVTRPRRRLCRGSPAGGLGNRYGEGLIRRTAGEEEGSMPITYHVSDRVLAEQDTAVVRGEMPAAQLPTWLVEAYRDVVEYLVRSEVAPTGPAFARFTFLPETVAVEAGFPVPHQVAGDGAVEPSRLPGGPAAVTTHIGRYEELDKAYEAVNRWLAEHGRAQAGPHWEVYHTDPNAEPDPTAWRTEVVVPYRVDS